MALKSYKEGLNENDSMSRSSFAFASFACSKILGKLMMKNRIETKC